MCHRPRVVGESTAGYSFAYLKELVASALMKLVSAEETAFETILMSERATLSEEMKTRKGAKPVASLATDLTEDTGDDE